MTILPKGELAGEESESKMLSALSQKGSYYFDYVTRSPGQPKVRRVYSLNYSNTVLI